MSEGFKNVVDVFACRDEQLVLEGDECVGFPGDQCGSDVFFAENLGEGATFCDIILKNRFPGIVQANGLFARDSRVDGASFVISSEIVKAFRKFIDRGAADDVKSHLD